jgi:hypothetical protein
MGSASNWRQGRTTCRARTILDNGARSSSKEINEGAVGAQAERALQNLRRALAAVGQSADDLVFGGHPNNRCGGAD